MRIYNRTEQTIQLEPGEYITSHQINYLDDTINSVEIETIPEGFNNNHSSDKDDAYEDRNLAVLGWLKQIHSTNKMIEHVEEDLIGQGFLAEVKNPEGEVEIGWREAPNFSDDWVYVWISKRDNQLTWAMPKELVEPLDWLEKKDLDYDGHSRKEKNDLIRKGVGLIDDS